MSTVRLVFPCCGDTVINKRKDPRGFKEAVAIVRRRVFERSGGLCENCARPVTWESGHMHERKPRGKGGEISVKNSVFICAKCHLGPQGEHGNRRPRFGESVRADG